MNKVSFIFAAGLASMCLAAAPVLVAAALPLVATPAFAKEHGGGGGGAKEHGNGNGGGSRKSRPHNHANGHSLLGANIKQDGKHALGNLHGKAVAAEVHGGKVVNMTAGDQPMTKVRSKQKMASGEFRIIPASFTGGLKLAQYDGGYESYGYCYDDGYETTCYWYEPSDVDTSSGGWQDYDTYDSSYY